MTSNVINRAKRGVKSMSKNKNPTSIILDCANIMFEKRYDGENRTTEIKPRRIVNSFEKCMELGYGVKGFINLGSYHGLLRNQDDEVKNSIDSLIGKGILKILEAKDEDIHWIDKALEDNSYIITKDTFRDKYEYDEKSRRKTDKNGEFIISKKRERSKYPDRDWEKVDKLLINDFEFIDDIFSCPRLTKISQKQDLKVKTNVNTKQEDDENIEERLGKIESNMSKIFSVIDALSSKLNITSYETKATQKDKDILIVKKISDELLLSDEVVNPALLKRHIAALILNLPLTGKKWPSDWSKQLNQHFGFKDNLKFRALLDNLGLENIILSEKRAYYRN